MSASKNSKLLLCAAFACSLAVQVHSQGGTTKPTLGTVQMPGDAGKMKTIYQLGDKGKELHFTLDSATIATRYKAVGSNLVAEKDSRLLVLTFTVHNPLKVEQNGVHLIAGWSDKVFEVMDTLEDGANALDAIEKIEL